MHGEFLTKAHSAPQRSQHATFPTWQSFASPCVHIENVAAVCRTCRTHW